MKGQSLFDYYLSKRDYSGSEVDEYAQLLMTIQLQLLPTDNPNEFYELLEKADRLQKKLSVKDISEGGLIFRDEISLDDIEFV